MTDTFLSARWENIIMANYEVKAGLLQPYLPPGLELDHFHNKMYVSLVGFMFKRTRLFHIPIPFLGTFEEINLRFYVKRIQDDTIKRGVVFINETVPYKPVAWLANKIYKEHYTAIPAKSTIINAASAKRIKYEWKINNQWNHIAVKADNKHELMVPGELEEYIFEHYYGYTKINDRRSQEYKVNHPRWLVNKVSDHSIDCDFRSMYGNDFAFLSNCQPASVIMAAGSAVSVKWKRTEF
jgi:uncharacterized protein